MNPTKFHFLKTGAVLVLLVAMAQAVSDDVQSDQKATDGTGWTQFHQDLQNSGFSSSTAPRTNSTLWVSEDLGFQAGSSVAVADGKVFANGVDQIVAFDEFTGEVLWTAPFEKNADVCCSWFTPAYHEGKIYFSGMNTTCLSSEDGSNIWSYPHPSKKGAVDGSPMVVDGKVIASDWDGHHYFCLDELTGEEIWSFEVEGDAQSTPAVSEGRAVVGSWEWGLGGTIYCIDIDTGQPIWKMDTDNSPAGSAAIGDGRRRSRRLTRHQLLSTAESTSRAAARGSATRSPVASTLAAANLSGRRCRRTRSATGDVRWLTLTASSSSESPISTISAEPSPSTPPAEM